MFLIAGVSDGIDGWIARRFDQRSELGAYLDPIADKALLVSIFVTLGLVGVLPVWLVILVVSRDILIVGGVVLSWMLGSAVPIRPLLVSKANTNRPDRLRRAGALRRGLRLGSRPAVVCGRDAGRGIDGDFRGCLCRRLVAGDVVGTGGSRSRRRVG